MYRTVTIGIRSGLTRTALLAVISLSFIALYSLVTSCERSASAQIVAPTSIYRIGEKLSYNISFGKIQNAGYAETHVVSRGKIAGKEAIEIKARVKTIDLVSAAFFLFDESRTVFAIPETGLPHYVTTSSLDTVTPKETIRNFISQPTSNFDLLTLMFKARESGGIGSFPLFEGEQMHTVTFQGTSTEKVKTEAGDFDTAVSVVQSDFLTSNGIKELKINFSTDENRLPVQIRLKTAKGDFRVLLSAITLPEPEVPAPTPSPTPSPNSKATPPGKPTPTPVQYVDNQPLITELGFELGEVLDYRVTYGGKPAGVLTLNARERKLFEKVDSLLLTATVSGVEAGSENLILGEAANVQVDPETLAPTRLEAKFTSPFSGLKQIVTFDKRTGSINYGAKTGVDAPIGTHSFLSLLYAMRSFNLKPSKDLSNPVNDTRVAVFWETKSYVFTLRPSNPTDMVINGETISAQLITVNTGNKELDALGLKVWLRTEDRVPVRFSAGAYQAELISRSSNLF